MRKFSLTTLMVSIALLTLGFSGCMSGSSFQEIKGQDLQKMLDSKENIALVDIRDAKDYAKGHIPNAINIPFTEFSNRYTELKPDVKTVLICYSGGTSKSAAQFLLEKKYTNIVSVSGGMMDWSGAVTK
jgi:rhodanese-related sulfurtransferase